MAVCKVLIQPATNHPNQVFPLPIVNELLSFAWLYVLFLNANVSQSDQLMTRRKDYNRLRINTGILNCESGSIVKEDVVRRSPVCTSPAAMRGEPSMQHLAGEMGQAGIADEGFLGFDFQA